MTATTPPAPYPGRWIAMTVLLVAGFMNLIDVTIVNVALPSMQRALGASDSQIEWVVAAYILAFALGLLPFGRLGDSLGRRRMFIAGVGVLIALAVEAFAPDMVNFKRGRDFAAWLGLVPRQYSSGGKERLGRVSKAGQADIRRLLIMGAMSRLNCKSIPEGSWLARMLAKKPKMLVAIALANKIARAIWAMLTKQEDYRDPAQAEAA